MTYRTHNLGELRLSDVSKEVTLSGWVATKRDLGGLTFIDLRDREGITQIMFDPKKLPAEIMETVSSIRTEAVIKVTGEVIERYSKNLKIPTGEIEIEATKVTILNNSDVLPFQIHEENLGENTRLKYRYLDLRRSRMMRNISKRHSMLSALRRYLDDKGFFDIDTPLLTKSTPEGARDFLVPSRSGEFYALPQSPQLFKQLLMISGMEKYYQIAKCFRDEDLRADRQPEFTQLDLEMSFVTMEDVMNEIEGLAKYVFSAVTDEEANYDFPRMEYAEAMERFGSDKPDTRFSVELKELTPIMKECGFKAFSGVANSGGLVKAVVAPNVADKFSRKVITDYESYVKTYFGAKGLAWIKVLENGEVNSPIAKFFSEEELKAIIEATGSKANDVIFILADKSKVVYDGLGALRLKLGHDLELIDYNKFNFLWVVDFPMFEYSEEEDRYKAQHHPFTSIKEEDLEAFFGGEMEAVRTNSYDLVLNGSEIGGGSIRIHNPEIQAKVFEKLGLSQEEARTKFGFFIDAFKYGAPPHGGLAFGIDRWLMVMLKESSIRDVIPFPKTNKGQCLMTEAPGIIEDDQLEELFIKSTFVKEEEK